MFFPLAPADLTRAVFCEQLNKSIHFLGHSNSRHSPLASDKDKSLLDITHLTKTTSTFKQSPQTYFPNAKSSTDRKPEFVI